jgi:hypothetical protein
MLGKVFCNRSPEEASKNLQLGPVTETLEALTLNRQEEGTHLGIDYAVQFLASETGTTEVVTSAV